jgi:predicted phage baseplate assembly protein
MIPARGARNVRMTRYRAGGGIAGNVAAGAIATLMAGSKQIARIGNLFAAEGGSVAEEPAALRERAPKKLRHRERAVTQDDYQDLAELASGEVARALCVPLQDLRADPYKRIHTIDDEKAGVGRVSVIIVPRSGEPKPLPSPDLMQRVQAYLAERASAGVAIAVVGALYLSANVTVTVYLSSLMLRNQVESELLQRLSAFLHPLTGNGGSGWPFGRRPYESDLYALIANVPGVAYVANLTILLDADNDSRLNDIIDTGRFLIYSGNHTTHLELAS